MEQWKSVKDYEGYYEVSTDGRVRSMNRVTPTGLRHNTTMVKKGKILKLALKRNGYLAFTATIESKAQTKSVHRVLAEAFIPNPENKPETNHINAIRTDNRVENLEWVTHKENMEHASKIGNKDNLAGKQIQCVETKMIFRSSRQAAQWLNANCFQYSKNIEGMSRNIRAVCIGKRNSAFGYGWKDLI